jgi:hypothetical protein
MIMNTESVVVSAPAFAGETDENHDTLRMGSGLTETLRQPAGVWADTLCVVETRQNKSLKSN